MWLQLIRDLSVLVGTPCFSWAWTNHDGFSGPQTRLIMYIYIYWMRSRQCISLNHGTWYRVVLLWRQHSILVNLPVVSGLWVAHEHIPWVIIAYCRFWSSTAPLISVPTSVVDSWGISRNIQYFPPNKGSQGPKGFFLEIVVLNQIGFILIIIDPYRSTYPTNKKPLVLLQSARYQHLWPMGDAYPQTFDRLALPFRCADGGEEDGMGMQAGLIEGSRFPRLDLIGVKCCFGQGRIARIAMSWIEL